MDLQTESPESPDDSCATDYKNIENSCILVEKNITIVDLTETDDTLIQKPEFGNESAANDTNSVELIEDSIPGEFQIIDEVGGSQEIEGNNEEKEQDVAEGELNGVRVVYFRRNLNLIVCSSGYHRT